MVTGPKRNGPFAYGPEVKPDEVLAEITHDYNEINPNIGKVSSCNLFIGKRSYRFAVMRQILKAETGEHHHNSLTIYSYQKFKKGWVYEDEKTITLMSDNSVIDEIGILWKFIQDFEEYKTTEIEVYGLIKQSDYDRFQKIGSSEVGQTIRDLLSDAENYEAVVKEGGLLLVSSVLEWVFRERNSKEIVEKLQSLELNSLQKINTVSGIIQMQKMLDLWEENSNNCVEEFWQKIFKDNSWIIAQLFTYPAIIYKDKAYVGGQAVDNTGSHLADFLFQHRLTKHVDIIEIKTPCANLMGSPYRQTFEISKELNGAVNQTLDYRNSIQKKFVSLKVETPELEVCNPKSVIVIGNMAKEFRDAPKKAEAFILYRQNLKDIQIITFDELIGKIIQLKSILETGQ